MRGGAASRALAVLAFVVAAGWVGGCAEPVRPTARTVQPRYAEPRWEDVFDTTPELLAILSPTELRSDKMYGSLLRRVIELARQQSAVVAQTRALDAMEDAEQVLIGMRPDVTERAGEVVVVVRGVPANVDPVSLVDADGHALWEPGPPGPVRELVRVTASTPGRPEAPVPASLFELTGRTWVIASGDARDRARAAFAHPLDRPSLHFDGGALALVRIAGPSLVARIPALQPSGAFGAVGHKLDAFTFELPPGTDKQVRATLSYSDEDAAALSEVNVREVLDAIARKRPERLAWLSTARLERPGKRVVVTAPLPPSLVDALLHLSRPGAEPLEMGPAAP